MNHGCRVKVPLGVLLNSEGAKRRIGCAIVDVRGAGIAHARLRVCPAGSSARIQDDWSGFGKGKKKGPTLSDRTSLTEIQMSCYLFVNVNLRLRREVRLMERR